MPQIVVVPATDRRGFDWIDAGIGAGRAAGVILLTTGTALLALRRPVRRPALYGLRLEGGGAARPPACCRPTRRRIVQSSTKERDVSVSEQVQIGTEVVGYRVEELVGTVGMGVVYRATDPRLRRQVALKLLAPELARDARFRRRFLTLPPSTTSRVRAFRTRSRPRAAT